MRSCLDLFSQSAISYRQAPTKPEAGPMPSPDSPSSEASFLASLSAMLTSNFHQTATSALDFTAPPRPPPNVPKDTLDALALDVGIRLLHNHLAYVRLNPIVTDVHAVAADSDEGRRLNVPKLLAEFAAEEQSMANAATATSPTDTEAANLAGWTHYAVTDALPHPFGLPGNTVLKYTIALRDLPDGIESLVASPGGVTIHGDIRVVRAAEGRDADNGFRERRAEKTLWLQERAEVRCWVGTAWYIRKTLGESHESAHEWFRAWWEREVRSQAAGGSGTGN